MKKKNPIHAYKRLLAKDHDWDYGYLIALEKKKLQRMYDYFKTSDITENNKYTARDIAICIRLLDIIMEKDAVQNSWLNESFSGRLKYIKVGDIYKLDTSEYRPIADFPVYVNVRNERRFFRCTPIKDSHSKGKRAIGFISRLRQEKALHLYHLIREYKLFGWWC